MRKNYLVAFLTLFFAFGTVCAQSIKQNVSIETENSSLVFSVDETMS